MKNIKKIMMFIFMLSLLIFSTSCKKEKDIKNEIKKEYNIPKELIKLMDNIDKTELKILELKKELEKSEELEIQKEKEEMIKKLQEIKKPEENTSKVESELKSVETYKEKIESMWKDLDKLIKESHIQLNNYKIIAVEEKAEQKKIEKIEEDLNNLTVYMESKDVLNMLINNNEIREDISYFLSLYKEYESRVEMLKYNLNRVYIYGLKDEWDRAIEGIDDVEGQYSEMTKEFNKELKEKNKKTEDDKKKEKNIEKLKLSLDSLKQSLDKKDINLLEIKRIIVITDLKKVE